MSFESDHNLHRARRPPIAILGVPFDNVTKVEAIGLVEQMIASRQPHYVVTPNVDFLVQARRDVELRRILFEAHLVLCDGTPLVWASRLLGNALPERVAGADLVPLLIQLAAQKRYRLFLLGAAPESARRAVSRLEAQYPSLIVAGHYSPPFNQLLEMDHEEIKRRIRAAKPDLLFVSFGCPKQEKWVAMHYRNLGVPVTSGVGATIDFLAGEVKRAPLWMQRSGTEWIFRLAQEPRRLFRRYVKDLWVFGTSIFPQWWELRARSRHKQKWQRSLSVRSSTAGGGISRGPAQSGPIARGHRHPPQSEVINSLSACARSSPEPWFEMRSPDRLDFTAISENPSLLEDILQRNEHCILEMHSTQFVDSTGIGFLIRLQKNLHAAGCELVLLSPGSATLRALKLMRLENFFRVACDREAASRVLLNLDEYSRSAADPDCPAHALRWRGEITAANADSVWERTQEYLAQTISDFGRIIDLSEVRFIDSTGLGLMIRAKKLCLQRDETLLFYGLQPPVRNVLRLSRVEDFLLNHQVPRGPQILSGRA